jgi:hypothetical protein
MCARPVAHLTCPAPASVAARASTDSHLRSQFSAAVRAVCVMTCIGHARPDGPALSCQPWSLQSPRGTVSAAAPVKRQRGGHPYHRANAPVLRSCFRGSPAYEQQMGDEGRTPLIRPGRPPVISRWRRRACRSQLARRTPSPKS